jgi:hypothetical protein
MASEFFPAIGDVADKTDLLPDEKEEKDVPRDAEYEDRPLQEVESLCMACGLEVDRSFIVFYLILQVHRERPVCCSHRSHTLEK